MFGYHDSDKCGLDLWSPMQGEGKSHALENRAFSGYAKHKQELDDIVTQILQKAAEGELNFTLDLDDDLSDEDLAYIEEAIQERF